LAKIRLKIEVKTKTVRFHRIEFSDEINLALFRFISLANKKMFFTIYFIKQSWYNGQVLGWGI
jgi:hypothetical protein